MYFIVSCLLSVYTSESNARMMVPKLSQWQALPWDEKQTYITVMNLATCFREQMQFALNKKLEHCSTTRCTVPIKGLSRLFGCTYNWKSDFVRINTDVLADLIWMCSSRRYSHLTPIHGHSLEIPKYQEEGALREKNLYVEYESFLEENNVWEEIINYKTCFQKYLTW